MEAFAGVFDESLRKVVRSSGRVAYNGQTRDCRIQFFADATLKVTGSEVSGVSSEDFLASKNRVVKYYPEQKRSDGTTGGKTISMASDVAKAFDNMSGNAISPLSFNGVMAISLLKFASRRRDYESNQITITDVQENETSLVYEFPDGYTVTMCFDMSSGIPVLKSQLRVIDWNGYFNEELIEVAEFSKDLFPLEIRRVAGPYELVKGGKGYIGRIWKSRGEIALSKATDFEIHLEDGVDTKHLPKTLVVSDGILSFAKYNHSSEGPSPDTHQEGELLAESKGDYYLRLFYLFALFSLVLFFLRIRNRFWGESSGS